MDELVDGCGRLICFISASISEARFFLWENVFLGVLVYESFQGISFIGQHPSCFMVL